MLSCAGLVNLNFSVYTVIDSVKDYTTIEAKMIEREPHLLPSVNSVPGRSLCPEGGWPLEGAWQSWPYLQRQRRRADKSLSISISLVTQLMN